MFNVALIGCGVIGNAMKVWIEKNNPDIKLFISDEAKGYTDNVYDDSIQAYFISINVLNNSDNTQDYQTLENIIKKIRSVNINAPIWIRSTITLSTYEHLNKLYNVNYMPEFLTERNAVNDFENIDMVYTPSDNISDLSILKNIFNNRPGIELTSVEAIFAKYCHNIYGALKVTYFNCVKDLCDTKNIDFERVKLGMFIPGHISKLYTSVPGPDGQYGYGGKCFPKDTDAFLRDNELSYLNLLLKDMSLINRNVRGE